MVSAGSPSPDSSPWSETAIQNAKMAKILSFTTAVPGLVACLLVCYGLRKYLPCFVCRSRHRHMTRFGHKDSVLTVICMLSMFDAILCCGYLLNFANDDDGICVLQGATLEIGLLGAVCISTFLAYELWLVVASQGDLQILDENRRRLKLYMFGTALFLTITAVGTQLGAGFGSSEAARGLPRSWCWVHPNMVVHILGCWLWVGLGSVAILYLYRRMCRRIMVVKRTSSLHIDAATRRKMNKTMLKMMLYPISLLIMIIPGIADRIYIGIYHQSSPTLHLMHAVSVPMIGLCNFVLLALMNREVQQGLFHCCYETSAVEDVGKWETESHRDYSLSVISSTVGDTGPGDSGGAMYMSMQN